MRVGVGACVVGVLLVFCVYVSGYVSGCVGVDVCVCVWIVVPVCVCEHAHTCNGGNGGSVVVGPVAVLGLVGGQGLVGRKQSHGMAHRPASAAVGNGSQARSQGSIVQGAGQSSANPAKDCSRQSSPTLRASES